MLSEAMFSNLRSFSAIFCGFLLIAATVGCQSASTQKAVGNMREFVHPNGLAVKLSENFTARNTDDGFIVEPSGGANENSRVPVEIKIVLNKAKNVDETATMKQKTIGNRTIYYVVEKSEGGSGGETYDFNALEKAASGGRIEYAQTTQSKTGEPDFADVWRVIENTSLKK